MKDKFNIEDPLLKKHLKENSFSVPENYFSGLRMNVSGKISEEKEKVSFLGVVRPQLALVSVFVITFFIIYGAFSLFTTESNNLYENTHVLSENDIYFNEGLLKTTFIDFFDSSEDSLSSYESEISEEELITYLSENIDIVTLSYLETKD